MILRKLMGMIPTLPTIRRAPDAAVAIHGENLKPLVVGEIVDLCAFFICKPAVVDCHPFTWVGMAPYSVTRVHALFIFLVVYGALVGDFLGIRYAIFNIIGVALVGMLFHIRNTLRAGAPFFIVFGTLCPFFFRMVNTASMHYYRLAEFAT